MCISPWKQKNLSEFSTLVCVVVALLNMAVEIHLVHARVNCRNVGRQGIDWFYKKIKLPDNPKWEALLLSNNRPFSGPPNEKRKETIALRG